MNSAMEHTPAQPQRPASVFVLPGLADTSDRDAESIRELVRTGSDPDGEAISGPSTFAVTLQLLDRVERLQHLGEALVSAIESESGLRRAEFQVLRALEVGDGHPRHVGRAIGMQTEAVLATADGLTEAGLMIQIHDQGRVHELVLTDAGRSVLAQAEAVQIRAADAAVQHVGPESTARALAVLDRIVDAVAPLVDGLAAGDDLPADTPPGPRLLHDR